MKLIPRIDWKRCLCAASFSNILIKKSRRRKKSREMGKSSSSSSSSPSLFSSLAQLVISIAPLFFLSSSEQTYTFKGVNLESPVVHFVPSLHDGYFCERVHVTGASRLNIKHYASALHITLKVSDVIPEKLLGKIEVCSHRNASIGLCQCGNDDWKPLQKGQWSAVMSPYEKRYIDVKVKDKLPVSATFTVEEEFQLWRLSCLVFGFLLLLLAPVVSTWVPFYVCSSMAIGVLGVSLILVFQLMKLLPMGRKNILYITLYGSVLGVGSYIAQYFSTVVNSILVNFGLSEEMHYPVSVFLLVWVILAGAAFGYWIVRKYIISEDGSIDAGIAQFVKWAMRILAVVSVLQSSLDSLLPVIALGIYWCVCFLVTSKKQRSQARLHLKHSEKSLWQPRTAKVNASNSRPTEFLSRSPKNDFGRSLWRSSNSPYRLSNSNMRATAHTYSSSSQISPSEQEDHYSTFHKTPVRRYSKTQWEDFTRESTREALAEWASSPEVTKWIADNAHRMHLDPDHISDDSMESSSDSSDETVVENVSGLGFFKWY